MLNDLKIFHKIYNLIRWFHPILNKFPKSEKYTLAQRIENNLLDILEGIIISNNEIKKISLKKVNVDLDKLRVFLRLSKDFRFISISQYEQGLIQVEEIGRMVGGLLKKFDLL